MFIHFWDKERHSMNGEGQRERETQNPKQAPGWAVSTEPDVGLELMDRDIMTWAEVGHLTHWATQALLNVFSKNRFPVNWEGLVTMDRP